jgi:large subunit ribosomal protein L23
MNPSDVIKGPLITEKLDRAREKLRQYSFVVDRQATKHDVRRAVESLFRVGVEGVRTHILRGKTKRVGKSIGQRPKVKKAIVTLKEGEKIDLFEGGAA